LSSTPGRIESAKTRDFLGKFSPCSMIKKKQRMSVDPFQETTPSFLNYVTKTTSLWTKLIEWWRSIVSFLLAFIIYVFFSWLPNFIAFLLTGVLLSAFGQYDVSFKKRKIK
jgi:hypothetical protein